MPRQPKRSAGKRMRARIAAESKQERCVSCKRWMPVGHACPSQNKANVARGNRAVFAVRFPHELREQLDALAVKRTAARSWPRTTAASLVVEAVRALLASEA